MAQWKDTPYWSQLELPIGRLSLNSIKGFGLDKPITGYNIVLEDGEYGDGSNFAEKEIAVTDLAVAKQEAISFLREKIQETLEVIDNG